MSTIWFVDSSPRHKTWLEDVFQRHIPQATVLHIASRKAWHEQIARMPWPDLIITEHHLGGFSVSDILETINAQNLGIPVVLFSDQANEQEIARLFETGLTDYIPKTPLRPLVFAARVRRILQNHIAALARQFAFLQQLDASIFSTENARLIAREALTTIANIAEARWAASAFVDTRDLHTAEVLATHNPLADCLNRPGQKCLLTDLPLMPAKTSWEIYPTAQLPHNALQQALLKEGVHWFGVYRFPIGAHLLGLLHLGWQSKSDFSPAILQFAANTARWMSSVIYRAIQLREERHALRQAQVLNDLVLSLSRSLDADTVLARLLDGLQTIVPYERASVWLWNEDGSFEIQHLRGCTLTKEEFQQHTMHYKTPPHEWATTAIITGTQRPLLIPDTRQFDTWQNLDMPHTILSWLGVPLVYNEQVLGIVALDASSPHKFTAQHTQMAQNLASAAATALQNARLFQHEQQRRRELNALRLASLQLVSSLATSDVLSNLLQQAVGLVNADDAHIFFYDNEKISFAAAIWDEQIQPKPFSEPRPNGITYTVARSGKPRLVSNVAIDPLFADSRWEGAIISMPLIAHGQVRGVMNVAWHYPRKFKTSETELLHMLADHAAIALENAHLVQRLQDKIRQLSALSRSSAAFREADRLESVAQTLTRQAQQIAHADYALLIRFLDNDRSRSVVEHVIGFPKTLVGSFFPTQISLADKIMQTNRALIFQNLSQSPLIQHRRWVNDVGPAIALPLHTPVGEMVGMLLVGRPLYAAPFTEEDVTLLSALAEMGATALQRAQAYMQLEEAFMQTVLALSRAMDVRDTYHGDHSKQLSEWAAAIAHEMGLSTEETEIIRLAALLHDIGKIGIPDDILLKPGPLTRHEWKIMRRHPIIGAQILRPLERLKPVAEIVAAHHERWDGSGYPYGLQGEDIPLGARILAVVDSYAAMIDRRVYHEPKTHEEAVEEIRNQSGRLYDPKVIAAFQAVMDYLNTPVNPVSE